MMRLGFVTVALVMAGMASAAEVDVAVGPGLLFTPYNVTIQRGWDRMCSKILHFVYRRQGGVDVEGRGEAHGDAN